MQRAVRAAAARKTQRVDLRILICNQKVGGSIPSAGTMDAQGRTEPADGRCGTVTMAQAVAISQTEGGSAFLNAPAN